jgi:hypothetical protein
VSHVTLALNKMTKLPQFPQPYGRSPGQVPKLTQLSKLPVCQDEVVAESQLANGYVNLRAVTENHLQEKIYGRSSGQVPKLT